MIFSSLIVARSPTTVAVLEYHQSPEGGRDPYDRDEGGAKRLTNFARSWDLYSCHECRSSSVDAPRNSRFELARLIGKTVSLAEMTGSSDPIPQAKPKPALAAMFLAELGRVRRMGGDHVVARYPAGQDGEGLEIPGRMAVRLRSATIEDAIE
jgi:hypothetical protein